MGFSAQEYPPEDLPSSEIETVSSASRLGKWILYHCATWEASHVGESESVVSQSCPTLCEPMDCSPPGSSVHGILQARLLEWAAIPFSQGTSWPRDRTQVSRIAGSFCTIWATRETLMLVGASNLNWWGLGKFHSHRKIMQPHGTYSMVVIESQCNPMGLILLANSVFHCCRFWSECIVVINVPYACVSLCNECQRGACQSATAVCGEMLIITLGLCNLVILLS